MYNIPNWVNKYLNEQSLKKISDTVKEVEKSTSAELVPMVVKRSSTIGHIPLLLFFFLWIIFLVVIFTFNLSLFIFSYWSLFLYLVFSLIISITLSRMFFFQRILTSKQDQEDQVLMRAQLEFYQSNIKKTKSATGILLFLSLMERKAVVLADDTIAKKLPDEVWQEIIDIIIIGIKNKDMAQGICDALNKSKELLVPLFPIKSDDINELANNLIIKE